MPLQQLVEYFNDRLELEHQNSVRAFVLKKNQVYGLYGPLCITSQLMPIRQTQQPELIIGHHAQLTVAANQAYPQLPAIVDSPDMNDQLSASDQDSVINFDRLSRTVHMLNYLPQAHLDELLFLEVDPRHILGIKEDHGAYFEEIIHKCGLQTNSVVISLTVNDIYARLYPVLLKGLENYQRRGYRLALKFHLSTLDKSAKDLITRVSPDYTGLLAQQIDQSRDNNLLDKLQELCSLTASVQGKSIIFNANDQSIAILAQQIGFNFAQGDYYEQINNAKAANLNHVNRPVSMVKKQLAQQGMTI